MPKGKCLFQEKLMDNEEYKSWLKPGKTVYLARCSICKSEFSVEWGCSSAVKAHHKGQTHKRSIEALESSKKGLAPLFFRVTVPATSSTSTVTSSGSSSSASASNSVSASSSATSISVSEAASTSSSPVPVSASSSRQSTPTPIEQLLSQQVSTTRAEIIWVLRVVKNHNSFRSCLGLGEDLKDMFKNDDIVANFTLSKTKCAYFVTHGIAPWVKSNLQTEINNSCFFSVSFDESLNQALQENQMDIQIRFWSEKLKAVTRYWGSEFQLNTDAETLKDNLMKALGPLSTDKQIQLAMDGPNTNWKILKLVSDMRDEEEFPPLENIGSCGLHVISGALHTGVVAGKWPIEKLLRAMFKFLHNSPARRAEYLRVSSGSLWPEKFCGTRWVENVPVANRAIEIWMDYVKLIKVFVGKCASKQPKDNKSYDNLKDYHTNPLIIVYLHLFRDVGARLNSFLVKFQTDAPMVPFLSEEMAGILRWLMSFFIQKDVLKKANSAYLLSKLKVTEDNWRLKTDMKLTTSGAEALKKVPSHLHQGLKDSWVLLLKAMVEKIQERSPITHKLVRVAAALDPVKMAASDADPLQSLFDAIVDIMYKNKRITAKQGDSAKEQFGDFLQKVVKVNKNEFLKFDYKQSRIDEFLGFYVNPKVYRELWLVCKFVFILSHGQSSVERGFNINKQTLVDNLKEVSLTSLRTVYDEIIQYENIRSFPIDNSLLLSCRSAGTRYRNELQQKRDQTKDDEKNLKRKQLGEDLSIVKKQKVEMEVLAKELDADADKFISEANKCEDLGELRKLVAKADSFKKSAKEKRKNADEYSSTIQKMEEELSSLRKK